MTQVFYLKLYALTVAVFFAVDLIWLGLVARSFYKDQLGSILSPSVHWPVALGFYLVYVVGILIFAVAPALAQASATRALVSGALFGFFTYATYDLTNLATIKGWPWPIAVVDILWGTLLGLIVATASFYIGRWLG